MGFIKPFLWCGLLFLTYAALAQEALPVPGGGNPTGGEGPAVNTPEDTKEYNKDIDDFEKNVKKEVPGAAKGGSAAKPDSAEKARQEMKRVHESNAKTSQSKKAKKPAAKKSKKSAAAAKKPKHKPKKVKDQ